MAEVLLDKLADDAVSGLKGFFTHRISVGEDPTACMQMFLTFLESNRDKNPQFIQKIASRIDSSFFAPLRTADRIISPDDFMTAYHALVSKLLEIHPQIPHKADYERQGGLFEKTKSRVKDRLLREKQEKIRILDDEYNGIISERKKHSREIEGGSLLTYSLICAFALSGVSFLALTVPAGLEASVVWICVIMLVVATIILRNQVNWLRWGVLCGLVFVFSIVFAQARSYPALLLTFVVFGIVDFTLLKVYKRRIADIQLTPQERSAYNTSLGNIEKHFAEKEKYEMAEATLQTWKTGKY